MSTNQGRHSLNSCSMEVKVLLLQVRMTQDLPTVTRLRTWRLKLGIGHQSESAYIADTGVKRSPQDETEPRKAPYITGIYKSHPDFVE